MELINTEQQDARCKLRPQTPRHNQLARIWNICTTYGQEVPKSRWETPLKVVENSGAKVLWDFQFRTD